MNNNLMNYVYDDLFVSLINSLSSSIKDFFKNIRSSFSELKSSADWICEQTLSSKSVISDILLQKEIMMKNIKIMDKTFSKFYEEAKTIFKKMKFTRNQKMAEVHGGEHCAPDQINLNVNVSSTPTSTHLLFSSQSREKNSFTPCSTGVNTRYNSHSPSVRSVPNGGMINKPVRRATVGGISSCGINQSDSNLMIANEKEIKEINEKIIGLTKRNEDLLGELKSMKNKTDVIKFENTNIRQTLETVADSRKSSKEPENRSMREKTGGGGVNFKPLVDNNNNNKAYGYSTLSENNKQKAKANSVDTRMRNNQQSNANRTVKNKNSQINLHKQLSNETNINTNDSRPEVAIAHLVLQFLNQMSNLQENISKRNPNVPELKKQFEAKKQELIKASVDITRDTSMNNIIPNKILTPRQSSSSKQPVIVMNMNMNMQCSESSTESVGNFQMTTSPKENSSQISFAGNDHESFENTSQVIHLNASIKSKEIEIERKIAELTSVNQVLLISKEKCEKLENEMTYIEEKLKEEKLKNKTLEEQKENLSNENIKLAITNLENENLISSLQDEKRKICSDTEDLFKKKQEDITRFKNGIEEFKIEINKMQSINENLHLEKEKCKKDFDVNLEHLTNENFKLKHEILIKIKVNEEMKFQISQKQKELDNLKKINEELNVLVINGNDEILKLMNENEELSDQIEAIKKNNSTEITKQSDYLKLQLREKQTEIESNINEITRFSKQIQDNQQELNELQSENKRLSNEKNALQLKNNQLEKDMDGIQQEEEQLLASASATIQENANLSKTLEEIKSVLTHKLEEKDSYIATVMDELEKAKNQIEYFTREKIKLNEMIISLSNEIEDNVTSITALKKTIKELNDKSNYTSDTVTRSTVYGDPEKYQIITDKQLNNLKWVLLSDKDVKESEMTYQNTYWVNSVDISISLYNQYVSENDYKKEIDDLLTIQSELLDKISQAQEDLSKCKCNCKFTQAIQTLDEDEKPFPEQLDSIKAELRLTREEMDQIKRKYEEAISIQDGKKAELISLLKCAFEKLVYEMNISGKIKEYLLMIFKLLDYTEEDINKIVNKKDKKGGGFLGLFGKK